MYVRVGYIIYKNTTYTIELNKYNYLLLPIKREFLERNRKIIDLHGIKKIMIDVWDKKE